MRDIGLVVSEALGVDADFVRFTIKNIGPYKCTLGLEVPAASLKKIFEYAESHKALVESVATARVVHRVGVLDTETLSYFVELQLLRGSSLLDAVMRCHDR